MSNVVIISITSDIGSRLAYRYVADGNNVIGTYRNNQKISYPQFYCDIDNELSVDVFIECYKKLDVRWDTIIFCPCNPLPLKPFFKCDFDEWKQSVETNSINQLRVLHKIFPYRADFSNVVFFAGGGINTSVVNFSAYTLSKVMLVKMCEMISDENDDVNIFAFGPGWVKTKIHKVILENTQPSDRKYCDTLRFINSDSGNSFDDIYSMIVKLCKIGRPVSGRNFSIYDNLSVDLSDPDLFKLRRNETEGSV